MRSIYLLGKILSNGYNAEILPKSYGSLLVVRNKSILSNSIASLIKQGGYRFKYCYKNINGESVVIFTKYNSQS
jgi:hypothetical protein